MTLWGRFLTLYKFWNKIQEFHKDSSDEWKQARSFLGNEEFPSEELLDDKKKCDQMISKPKTMPSDDLDSLEESLIGLYQTLKSIRTKVKELMKSRSREINNMLINNLDLKALQCVRSFMGKDMFPTKSITTAKTYVDMFSKAESILKKAYNEGVKLCGEEPTASRLWDLYKRLYEKVVVDEVKIDTLVGEEFSPDELTLLAKKKLIHFKKVASYQVLGFESCKGSDEDDRSSLSDL